MSLKVIITFLPRIIAAFILIQTLFFKFGIGGEDYLRESQMLFSNLMIAITGSPENESIARIGTGVLELIASIMLLISPTAWIGATLGIGLMIGALMSHVFLIGINVDNDRGQLMLMAIAVLLCCIRVALDEKDKIIKFSSRFISR